MAAEELPEGWVEIEEPECDENGDPLPPRAGAEQQPEEVQSEDPDVVPPPAPAAAAPGQPKKEKEKPEHDDGDIPWVVPDVEAYTLESRARVTFDRIRFDETATEGQARVLDPELVKKRHQELLTNPPPRAGAAHPVAGVRRREVRPPHPAAHLPGPDAAPE